MKLLTEQKLNLHSMKNEDEVPHFFCLHLSLNPLEIFIQVHSTGCVRFSKVVKDFFRERKNPIVHYQLY